MTWRSVVVTAFCVSLTAFIAYEVPALDAHIETIRMRNPAYREKKRLERIAEAEHEAWVREQERLAAEEEAIRKKEEAEEAAAKAAREKEEAVRREADRKAAAAIAEARGNPERRMRLENAKLYKRSVGDLVLSADLTIRNDNDFPVTDVTVRCAAYDRARTELDASSTTIGKVIGPHTAELIPNIETTLFFDGCAHAGCTILAAEPR